MNLRDLTELLVAVQRHLIQSRNIISVVIIDREYEANSTALAELSEALKDALKQLLPIIDELKD